MGNASEFVGSSVREAAAALATHAVDSHLAGRSKPAANLVCPREQQLRLSGEGGHTIPFQQTVGKVAAQRLANVCNASSLATSGIVSSTAPFYHVSRWLLTNANPDGLHHDAAPELAM